MSLKYVLKSVDVFAFTNKFKVARLDFLGGIPPKFEH